MLEAGGGGYKKSPLWNCPTIIRFFSSGLAGFFPVHPKTYMKAWRNRAYHRSQLTQSSEEESSENSENTNEDKTPKTEELADKDVMTVKKYKPLAVLLEP